MANLDPLTIEDFGRGLLETGDLDPVYIALPKAIRDQAQRHRWLVAYWSFYHCGFASMASEYNGSAFWDLLDEASENLTPSPVGGKWPRGRERRHFRAAASRNAIRHMRERYGSKPDTFVRNLIARAPNYNVMANYTQSHVSFGPWISFKVNDMVDRVERVPVDFDQAAVFMFKDPVVAALKLWRMKLNLPDTAKPKDQNQAITAVVEYLIGYFKDYMAPPDYSRPVGLQEAETILCKWKSHCNGHYPLGTDIREIREGVEHWAGTCKTASDFLNALPENI